MKSNRFYVLLLVFLTISPAFSLIVKSEDQVGVDKYDQEVPVRVVEVLFQETMSEDRNAGPIEVIVQTLSDFEGQRLVTFKGINDLSHADFIVDVMGRIGIKSCFYQPFFSDSLNDSVCNEIMDKINRKFQELTASPAE